MKKNRFIAIALLPFFCLKAESFTQEMGERIRIKDKGHHGTHFDFPVPSVEPEVYYDDVAQVIIIVGTGNLSYYDVEIESATTWYVYISTQVNGYYDAIDVSFLPSDTYTITIDTSLGLSYEGEFIVN